jgi:hypothetical protein
MAAVTSPEPQPTSRHLAPGTSFDASTCYSR